MASPFLSELRIVSFDYPPKGWAFCNGQLLPINQNQALFSLLGTTYGGNGVTTFALPNLQGRLAVGMGSGPGLSSYPLGEFGGEEAHVLTVPEMHFHTHGFRAGSLVGTVVNPSGEELAVAPDTVGNVYGSAKAATHMPDAMVLPTGQNWPHENRMPTLNLRYIIALQGIFPSRS